MHTNKWFLPSFSQLRAHLGIWLLPALLNQGFAFSFARKKSSALFFPQPCYSAVFLVTWQSLISTVTAFSKEVSPPFYRCDCEAQRTLRHIPVQGAFFCFISSLQSVGLLLLKARRMLNFRGSGHGRGEKRGEERKLWHWLNADCVACFAVRYLLFRGSYWSCQSGLSESDGKKCVIIYRGKNLSQEVTDGITTSEHAQFTPHLSQFIP